MSDASAVPAAPVRLPRLRGDLQLELIADTAGGFPSIVVTDPVRGSYFRFCWPHSGLLLHWREAESTADLSRRLGELYGACPNDEDLAALAQFVTSNQLTELDAEGGWQSLARQHKSAHHSLFHTIIHGYLFFRVPLLHPEPMLRRLLPHVGIVYRRAFWVVLALCALAGLHLASRQWNALVAAVDEALRLKGLAIYAVAVLGLKAVHELGHALTTLRYGCRVPTMGVAFMLGTPVLYTDTSDSWRLARRSERLAIVFAGVAAEMIVATIAIALWSFLPDGVARQVCFALATTSIALSIAVNLNPFMRYDGYFALSDVLEVPNLQPRAFKLALWRMREALFAIGHPPPEQWPRRTAIILIVYAVLTAIYRLVLFLGIAAAVYFMFAKALGIVLGLFEVVVFIAMPIQRELMVWWSLRSEIVARRRAWGTAAAAVMAVALVFLPLSATIEAPAVLAARNEEAIHLPAPARLVSIDVKPGQRVRAGEILFTADASDLRQGLHKARIEQRSLEFQVRRLYASDKERELRLVLESRLARASEKIAAMEHQIEQLVIRAPLDGQVVDLDPDISPGLWLNPKLPLARVVSEAGTIVKGYVADADLSRIAPGARARFVPDDGAQASQPAVLAGIAPASNGRLSEPALSERHGGAIAAAERDGATLTRHGWTEVRLSAGEHQTPELTRGVVHIDASRTSIAMKMWAQVGRVLVREQGF